MPLRIGIVGLGGIAQKVYLPLLTAGIRWQVVGAFSPNQQRAQPLCDQYRIPYYARLDTLADRCDAVFVHASTSAHYTLCHQLLSRGVHVYVDKPLAEHLDQAEQLVALAARKKRVLMVGFNRRFAPLYLQLKQQMQRPASIRVEKHRADSVGPQDRDFTLLDDYLHVIDTALWLAPGPATLLSGTLQSTDSGALFYAEHHFQHADCLLTTSMHRRAGSQRETVSAITDGTLYHIEEMRLWRAETAGAIHELPVPAWQTILTQRGFSGAVEHFIAAVAQETECSVSGEQALRAQSWINTLQA